MRISLNHVNVNCGVSFRILGQVGETAAKIKRHALRETDLASQSLTSRRVAGNFAARVQPWEKRWPDGNGLLRNPCFSVILRPSFSLRVAHARRR